MGNTIGFEYQNKIDNKSYLNGSIWYMEYAPTPENVRKIIKSVDSIIKLGNEFEYVSFTENCKKVSNSYFYEKYLFVFFICQ